MKTERLPCPSCGLPVELPVREDLAADERLCNACHVRQEPTPSARPWTIRNAGGDGLWIQDAEGRFVAEVVLDEEQPPTDAEHQANADLIVRAVNAHKEMVATLGSLLEASCECPGGPERRHRNGFPCGQADDLLRKVGG